MALFLAFTVLTRRCDGRPYRGIVPLLALTVAPSDVMDLRIIPNLQVV
jgi:hypothetical protein